ncbi:MAG: DUF4347 domain-containing protein, partial [Desulfosudaceae bacterium]
MFRIKGGDKSGRREKRKKQRTDRKERPYRFEALEPRLLLSAELGIPPQDLEDSALTPAPVVENVDRFNDVSATAAGDDLPAAEATTPAAVEPEKPLSAPLFANEEADGIRDAGQRQVVVVDPSVTDQDALVQAIIGSRQDARIFDLAGAEGQAHSSADSLLDIYLLDGARDGMAQVSEILGGYENLDAVHLFSHGDAGSLRLGDTLTAVDELDGRREEVAGWGDSLDPEGDLLLYGCSLAEGDTGKAFVETLASLTRADVAASIDPTGAADQGGDWDLEYTAGSVETPALSGSLADYSHLLETFVSTEDNETFTGTANNDIFSFEDGGGSNTLDFSAVTADLTFTFGSDNTVSVTDGENELKPAEGINNIIAGSGDNRFVFERDAAFAGTVDASAGAHNTLDFSRVVPEVDPASEETPDRTGLDLSVTVHSGGTVSAGADGSTIVAGLGHLDEIIGGSGDNQFVFENGAVFAGQINGGEGGSNTLDYAAYDSSVTVDLDADTATGTAGISNFSNIIGGSGNDVLTGDEYANDIDGGAGHDIIDGGIGEDTLTGGSEDDTFRFADDWGADTITDGDMGDNTLDFSQVTADLEVTFAADGTILVDDYTSRLETSANVSAITTGAGDDIFVFENGAAYDGLISGGSDPAETNTLDFSAYQTPVRIDLGAGTVDMGGFVNDAGDMEGLSADMPLAYLNDGAGVGRASVSEDTLLADLHDGAGVGEAAVVTAETLLSDLNDGTGVDMVAGNDLLIRLSTDEDIEIDLGTCTTLGDVLEAINNADSRLEAVINESQNGINISDSAGGDGDLTVFALNDSAAAADLGIAGVGIEGQLAGTALVHDLRLTLTDGSTADVSLAGAETLADVMTAIYKAGQGQLNAAINPAGNGLDIYDTAGGEGDLTMAALNGSPLAADLGLAGTGSGNLLAGSVLVNDLQITLSDGTAVTVALGGAATVGAALDAIHAADARLDAVINLAGNSLDISDAAGGAGNLTIADLGDSTAATDLGIAGTGAGAAVAGMEIAAAVVTATFTGMIDATGGSGADLLIGDNQNNTLIGGDGADTFRFANGWGEDIVVDYGEEGEDVLDLSAVTANLSTTFHDDGTVSVTDGTNTLDKADIIEGLITGAGEDAFTFEDGADFAGFIDGGSGGTNMLDYSAYDTAVTVDLAAGTATGTTGVENIDNLTGGAGDDTLTGDDQANTIIGGDGNDIITGGGGADTLIGGTGDDTYVMTADGTDTITELAGEGIDTLDYSAYTSSVAVDLTAGTATGTAGVSHIERVITGSAGDTLTGTDGDDTFVFLDDWGADAVSDPSAADSDTLDFSAVTQPLTVTFNGDGTVSVTDGTNSLTNIANIENLVGGSGDDTFVFQDDWGHYTIVSAGEIDNDILDFSAVTRPLTFTIHNDGTVSVTDDTNTLGASAGIDNIIGGSGTNTFVFEDQGYLDAYIDGGAGTAILDYSNYTTAVAVDLSRMDEEVTRIVEDEEVTTVLPGEASGVKGINNIDEVIGGNSAGDTLTGFEDDNTWEVNGANSGTVTGATSGRTVTFDGFENLAGQADYDDTFSVQSTGSVTGSLIGQAYGPSTGTDTVRIENGSYTAVTLAAAGQDSGWIERDEDLLRYIGINQVIDLSAADNKTVDNAADRTARVYLAGDPYEVDQDWILSVDGNDYTHTVADENERLADVLTHWVSLLQLAGYTAIVRDNTIQVTNQAGTTPDVTTTRADDTSTLPDGITALVEAPIASDADIRLDQDGGNLTVTSASGSFADLEMVAPTAALDLAAGAGDDHITVGAGFDTSAEVTIDGQAGSDRIVYEVQGIAGTTQDITR